MAGQDAEAAAGVFGAQRSHPVLVDDDLERRDDAQPHGARSLRAARGLFLARLVQVADHVERALRPIVGLAVEDRAAAGDRFGARHAAARRAR